TSDVAPRPASFTAPVAQGGGSPVVLEGRIAVTCTCGQVLQAREKYAGTKVRCPACGAKVLLPGKGTLPEPVEDSTQPPGPPPAWQQAGDAAEAGPGPDGVQIGLVKLVSTVLATVLVVGVLAGVGYFLYKKSKAPPPPAATESDKK